MDPSHSFVENLWLLCLYIKILYLYDTCYDTMGTGYSEDTGKHQ